MESTLLLDPCLVVSSALPFGLESRIWEGGMLMLFAHPLTFLRRAMAIHTLVSIMFALAVPFAWGASSPVKITIHIPGKSLAVLVFYFCKDKGFFFEEG